MHRAGATLRLCHAGRPVIGAKATAVQAPVEAQTGGKDVAPTGVCGNDLGQAPAAAQAAFDLGRAQLVVAVPLLLGNFG